MEQYKRNPNTFCLVCTKSLYRRPCEIRKGRVICSSKCYGSANKKEHPCVVCGISILSCRNKKTCSRSCANRNRTGIHYRTGRQKDKVFTIRSIKLRLIALRGPECERCRYAKKQILHVHHKDRNPSHNDFSNLELICPNCHYEEHYLEKSWLSSTLSD